MTKESLQRGVDIQTEIATLEREFNAINSMQLFNNKSGGPCYGSPSSVFLASLEVSIKSKIADEIGLKIFGLQSEFAGL